MASSILIDQIRDLLDQVGNKYSYDMKFDSTVRSIRDGLSILQALQTGRWCARCCEVKPQTEFDSPDYIWPLCRPCERQSKAWKEEHEAWEKRRAELLRESGTPREDLYAMILRTGLELGEPKACCKIIDDARVTLTDADSAQLEQGWGGWHPHRYAILCLLEGMIRVGLLHCHFQNGYTLTGADCMKLTVRGKRVAALLRSSPELTIAEIGRILEEPCGACDGTGSISANLRDSETK